MLNCALVIGSAGGVWEEVAEAKRLYCFDCIIAINSAGVSYPDAFDHWVSYHIDLFPHWIDLRKKAGYPDVTSFWSSVFRGATIHHKTKFPVQRIPCNGGSSGLIATLVGLKLCQSVVLTGVPLDPNRAHFDLPGSWDEAILHRKAWETYLPELKGRVTSMSGWTKELLERV